MGALSSEISLDSESKFEPSVATKEGMGVKITMFTQYFSPRDKDVKLTDKPFIQGIFQIDDVRGE